MVEKAEADEVVRALDLSSGVTLDTSMIAVLVEASLVEVLAEAASAVEVLAVVGKKFVNLRM